MESKAKDKQIFCREAENFGCKIQRMASIHSKQQIVAELVF